MNKKKIIIGIIIIAILGIVGFVIYLNFNQNNEIVANVVEYDATDENTEIPDGAVYVTLSDDNIKIDGSGATFENDVVTISSGGAFVFSGKLSDGNIVVDVSKSDIVQIFLNGVNITSSNYAVISVNQADKTIITLVDGTINTLTDGDSYNLANGEDEPNSTIFSKDDLSMNGSGTLIINANYNNGITSKDELKILNGTYEITANNHGIKGKDYTAIKGSDITIISVGDGIKSNNSEDVSLGYITIEDATINIEALEDGIQAETNLSIINTNLNIKTGGGFENATTSGNINDNWNGNTGADNDISSKGLKANNDIIVQGGTYIINSLDDSIHSNNDILIEDGNFDLLTGDDGIHADNEIVINDCEMIISQSYEGLEASIVTINGGNIDITASDDGINASGGDGSSNTGRPGDNFTNRVGEININGGIIYIEAGGDGIDSNNIINQTGGNLLISQTGGAGDSAIDSDGDYIITRGIVVAVGSTSNMVRTPSNSSSQYSIIISLNSNQSGGTNIKLTDSDGDIVIEYTPTQLFQHIIISSPKITDGTYLLYFNGVLNQTINVTSLNTTVGSNAGTSPSIR